MISYGGLSSRRPVYLNREMTVAIDTKHSAHVAGEIDLQQGDVSSPTSVSAVGESRFWSEYCQILKSEFAGIDVEMFSTKPNAKPLFSSTPRWSGPAAVTKETLAKLYALKSVAFLPESNSSPDKGQHANGSIRSLVAMLNFGFDGLWIVRVSQPAGDFHFSNDKIERLGHHAVKMERAALMSTRVFAAAVEAYASAMQHAQRPFALLDDAFQVTSWNKHFEALSTTYFQTTGGLLAPNNGVDAKLFREATKDLQGGRQIVEMSLRHEHRPCVVALYSVPLARFRLSGKNLIGLELRGALFAPAANSKLLAGLFGLTQREADVAALLSSGKSVNTIAEEHAVSVGTVRVQLKAIFRKMGVAGQVELISKVLGFRF